MKILKPVLLLSLIITFLSCGIVNSDLGDPVLTPSATAVSINEEVTITLSGISSGGHGPTPSYNWSKISGPEYTSVSGGGKGDKTWTVKFNETGTATIQCKVEACMHGSCRDERAETTITVQ